MRRMMTIVIAVVGIYAAIVAAAYFRQRDMMYFPDRERVAPATVGLAKVEELRFPSGDGVELIAWFKAPAEGRATILFFTGNAGSAAWRSERIGHYASRGYGFLILNYRGYGGSGGSPSEEGLIADGLAAAGQLIQRGIEPGAIVLHGESLGAGVAVQVATSHAFKAVVLEAPFTSAVDVAAKAYPFLPARWLMHDRFLSVEHIKGVSSPVMIVHGEADDLIPVSFGRRLFEAANEPKSLFVVPNAGHNDLDQQDVRARIERFIEDMAADGGS